MKWQNSAFIKLNDNFIVQEQSLFDYTKLETRAQGANNGAGAGLFYSGQNFCAGSSLSKNTNQAVTKRAEMFVSSMGESGANELRFFNLSGDMRANQCLKQVELTVDGCVYLSTHSKTHQTTLMISNNGSLFCWSPTPTKIIQSLAPGFHEIERNIWYVERENEFEANSDDEMDGNLFDSIKNLDDQGLLPLDERQKKMGEKHIDIDKQSADCISLANNI